MSKSISARLFARCSASLSLFVIFSAERRGILRIEVCSGTISDEVEAGAQVVDVRHVANLAKMKPKAARPAEGHWDRVAIRHRLGVITIVGAFVRGAIRNRMVFLRTTFIKRFING